MKSEHRHELKTNELGKIATQLAESSDKYLNQIIAVVVIVLVVTAGWVYWSRHAEIAATAGWDTIAAATTAEEFANVADKHPGTSVGAWARLKEGELYLASGLQLTFTDRASGLSDLKKAQESFEKITSDLNAPDDVRERALFGLGRCLESLSDGDNEPAIAAYQQMVEKFGHSAYRSIAEERIAALRQGSSQEFYSWFHEQNPKPADRELPRDIANPGGFNPADMSDPFNFNVSPGGDATSNDSDEANSTDPDTEAKPSSEADSTKDDEPSNDQPTQEESSGDSAESASPK